MNREIIDCILEKNPNLRPSIDIVKNIKEGAFCCHRTWGFGLIVRYDDITNRVIIDFESGRKNHAMAPDFCVKKLYFFDESHVMVEARKDPNAVKALMNEKPNLLASKILEAAPGKALTDQELELFLLNTVAPFLSPAQFKKWWFQAQKALRKDPNVGTPGKKGGRFFLRDIPVKQEEEILESFYLARKPFEKIKIASTLLQLSETLENIREELPQILETLTKTITTSKHLSNGEKLQGLWIRNDIAKSIGVDVSTLENSDQNLLLETEKISELVHSLPNILHKRFLNLIFETYSAKDEFQHICLQLLKNSSGKLTDECINFLIEKGLSDLVKSKFQKWLSEQTMKAPVICWIVKNREVEAYKDIIKSLLDIKFLESIFIAIETEALNQTGTKKIPLAELLNEDKLLINELIEREDEETVHDLAQKLLACQGLETLSKRSIFARFIRKYPKLQKLIESKEERTDNSLIVSKESLEVIKKEYESLISEKIPQNKEAIAKARELGDLRENSEYKMAKQDQDILLARKSQIEKDLARVQVTDFSDASKDVVSIGSIVELIDEKGKTKTFTILGAWDSKPKKDIISYKTPLGQALLGKKKGASVSMKFDSNSKNKWKIQSIRRWSDNN